MNLRCFQHLLKLLAEVVVNEQHTKLNATTLSVVFAPNCLVDGDPLANPFKQDFVATNGIFEYILANYDSLFSEVKGNEEEVPEIAPAVVQKKKFKRSASTKLSKIEKTIQPKTIQPTTPEHGTKIQKEGPILYQDKQKWVERFLIMTDNSLYRCKSAMDREKKNRVGYSSISCVRANSSLGKPFAFIIERPKKDPLVFAASSNEELQEWITSLLTCVVSSKK